ncbi:hypothetical protein GGI20_005692 [Coemansia sp. BCRC 34301]|nr:hypothetical protein GGI20_005692 [Coemansia sp. BCRC 34301]
MSTQKFTLRELEKHTGQGENKRIFLGLNGNVYDVSGGAAFYGPGKGYSVFAGCDCTIGLARSSLLRKDMPYPGEAPTAMDSLSEEEKKTALAWEARLKLKYPVVGVLVKEDESEPEPER